MEINNLTAGVKLNLTANETPPLGLWQQIKEDWIAHGRDWTKPGFRAVAVHRFGVWRMNIQPKLLRAPPEYRLSGAISKSSE